MILWRGGIAADARANEIILSKKSSLKTAVNPRPLNALSHGDAMAIEGRGGCMSGTGPRSELLVHVDTFLLSAWLPMPLAASYFPGAGLSNVERFPRSHRWSVPNFHSGADSDNPTGWGPTARAQATKAILP